MVGPGQPRDRVSGDPLQRHEGGDQRQDARPVGGDHAEVERHADAEKEQAEQDAAKRFDIGLELVPEVGFRKQHAGEERAHRHRQAADLHGERGAQHDQQRRCRHNLARFRGGKQLEHRVEQPAACRDQSGKGGERNADVDKARMRVRFRTSRRQEGDDREQRHDRQVLEQQDRHDALAGGRGSVAALLDDLHDDGRGRQHEAHAGHESDDRRVTGERAGDGQHGAADEDLRSTQPEDLAP